MIEVVKKFLVKHKFDLATWDSELTCYIKNEPFGISEFFIDAPICGDWAALEEQLHEAFGKCHSDDQLVFRN